MKYIWFAAVLLASLFTACEEDSPPPPPEPNMTILEAPAFLAANIDSCYTYRVRLENVSADSVTVRVRSPLWDLLSPFALYDDGGILPAGSPTYTCFNSGDLIPNDGQYTRQINAVLMADSVVGRYLFTFTAPDVREQTQEVWIRNVEPCSIAVWPQVSQFDSCFVPFDVMVQVVRSEGDFVDSVRVSLCDPLRSCSPLAEFVPSQGDNIWHLTLAPELFRCAQTADSDWYTLSYEAVTRFGQRCAQTVNVTRLTNQLPTLSGIIMPDTIYRPTQPGVAETTYVMLEMADCELAGDTSFVGLWFDASRDTTPWPEHPGNFFLRDNGRNGDVVAGDQSYTVGLLTTFSDSLFNNVYYFRFYALEGLVLEACNSPFDTSAFLYDSVRVIQPPGAFRKDKGERIKDEADFRVLN